MTANPGGVVTEADVQAARHAVDAWAEEFHQTVQVRGVTTQDWERIRLELRGLVTQLAADARTAGYLEGIQRGRQEAAHVVLDALRGEGLAPMPYATLELDQ